MTTLLEVENLQVEFASKDSRVQAVRGISFTVQPRETFAIVGESGCGKSVSLMSLLQLIPMPPGKIKGSALFEGTELIGLSLKDINKIRGEKIGFIFQDPMSAMNPTMRVGQQIAETLVVHRRLSKREAWDRAVQLMQQMGIAEPYKRAFQYPFEFSGGMLQRAMIAMNLACDPQLLIADEPTTALDVTIQNQVLQLLRQLQQEHKMAMILVTHDLGVVAHMAHRMAVMYAGKIVEIGDTKTLFHRTAHPYTLGLKQAVATNEDNSKRLRPIPGIPPDLRHPPDGCAYKLRCPYAMQICDREEPTAIELENTHQVCCWLHDNRCHNKVPKELEGES